MKIKFLCLLLICSTILSSNISCTKEQPVSLTQYTPPLPPPPPPSLILVVDVKYNMTLKGTFPFAILSGSVYGTGSNNLTYLWKKISGPASYSIDNPHVLQTKVSNLESGTYLFELKVTNSVGNYHADTMILNVEDPTSTSREIIFSNLKWSCPMGCTIDLDKAITYFPGSSSFTLYLRPGSSSNFELVSPIASYPNGRYFYSIVAEDISVYSDYEPDPSLTGKPEIKIIF